MINIAKIFIVHATPLHSTSCHTFVDRSIDRYNHCLICIAFHFQLRFIFNFVFRFCVWCTKIEWTRFTLISCCYFGANRLLCNLNCKSHEKINKQMRRFYSPQSHVIAVLNGSFFLAESVHQLWTSLFIDKRDQIFLRNSLSTSKMHVHCT